VCRLFGLSAAPQRITATFWLLDAPDSLAVQSRREPDGTGLGYFDADGTPRVHRRPIAAYADAEFAREAREVSSTTFLAHVRYASTGAVEERNTHPFCQDGRLFAHNGVVWGLAEMEAKLADYPGAAGSVRGGTDSERVFALITAEIARAGGDVTAGLLAACRWIAANVPVYALNLLLATPAGVWALRYPDTHPLYVLQRPAGGHHGRGRYLDQASAAGRVRVRAHDLASRPAVVIASEPMDESPDWRLLNPGELLRTGPHLGVHSHLALPDPPARHLTFTDLHPDQARSQVA
jgi:predicted glutamine amidotransferase